MTDEERETLEWLIAESMFMVQVSDQHRIKLGQLQAIQAWENRTEMEGQQ